MAIENVQLKREKQEKAFKEKKILTAERTKYEPQIQNR